jgi:hypothetical protein
MSWVSFITGGLSVILAYAFFSAGDDEEVEILEPGNGLVVNGVSKRFFQISCQTCRKLKNHREIEPNVYECTRCKRVTDLSRR